MTLRRLLVVPAAVAAAAVLPAVACAAAPWTDPVTIPGASPQRAPVVITAAGHGVTVAGADRSGAAPAGAASELIPLGLDGRPSGPARGLTIADAHLATYAKDRVVVAGSTLDAAGTIGDKSHVQVAFGSAGGDLGPLRGLTGTTGEHVFALVAGVDGTIALVTGNTRRRRLLIRHGGAFRVAFTVDVSDRARDATVAVGPKGDVLMLWEDDHQIYARHVGPTGGLGAPHRIGDGVLSRLQAAVDGRGRLLAAWLSQRAEPGASVPPSVGATAYFATAAPGHGFGAARRVGLAQGDGYDAAVADPGIRLVLGADDTAFLAVPGYDGADGTFGVGVLRIVGGHVAGRFATDENQDVALADLAAEPHGSVVLLWRAWFRAAAGSQQIVASVLPSTPGTVGAPETIATAPAGQLPLAPTLAVAPTTGAALAVIPSLTDPPGTLQVAARDRSPRDRLSARRTLNAPCSTPLPRSSRRPCPTSAAAAR